MEAIFHHRNSRRFIQFIGWWCIVYCVWCGVALWKINIHESYVEILTFNKKWNIKSLNTPEKNWIESNRGRRNLETDQIGCYEVEKKQVSHRWKTLYIILIVCLLACFLIKLFENSSNKLRIKHTQLDVGVLLLTEFRKRYERNWMKSTNAWGAYCLFCTFMNRHFTCG